MTTSCAENTVKDVKSFLSSYHMLAYDTWIAGLVEYFIEEGHPISDIKNNAYQQWLLNDLRYICPGSLPWALADLKKTTLVEKYVLQINRALDISVPAYQQYLKLSNTDTENIQATMNSEEKISNKRVLRFELTDGKQTLVGIEYETISKVKTEDIIPGSKVLISGPVQFIHGMLLLTNSTIKFLDGEVKNLLETHSLGAQLASKLHLPLIENVPVRSRLTTQTTDGGISGDSVDPQDRGNQNDNTNRQIPRLPQTEAHSNPTTTAHGSNERSPRQEETAVPAKKMKIDEEIVFDDVDMKLFEEDMTAIDECEQLHRFKAPAKIPAAPFVYFKQINDLKESDKCGQILRVKAQVQNVVSKLTAKSKREWTLSVKLLDGTGSLEAEIAGDILSKFFGYTPENIIELQKKFDTNPEIENSIRSAYIGTSQTLRNLYCIMELQMNDLPKIIKLIDFDESHVQLLNKRLNNMDVEQCTLTVSLT